MDNRQKAWGIQTEMCQLYDCLRVYFQSRENGEQTCMEQCLAAARESVVKIDKLINEDKIVAMPARREHVTC